MLIAGPALCIRIESLVVRDIVRKNPLGIDRLTFENHKGGITIPSTQMVAIAVTHSWRPAFA